MLATELNSQNALQQISAKASELESLRSTKGNAEAGEIFFQTGKIYIQGVEGVFQASEDGTWDWAWRGPKNDKEWAWLMNRHRFLLFLVDAGKAGNHEAYTRANDMLTDWIRTNPVPKLWSYSHSWRALEAARRIVQSWGPLLARDDIGAWVSPDLREIWLPSLVDHAKYLRKHHHFQGNHLITEMNALLLLAHLLDDSPDAAEWKEYALMKLSKQLDTQFFSDGMHRELSNHYHRIALDGLVMAAEIAPEQIAKNPKWVAAWTAIRDMTQPNGLGPLNNDGDIEVNSKFLERHAQWVPERRPSKSMFFKEPGPSGQFIASKRTKSLLWWIMADFGPYGTDHQHEDRLHVSWAVNYQSILVDNGRYHYRNDAWREYFRTQPAHNTIILEGARYLQPDWGNREISQAESKTLSGHNSDWSWAVAPKVFKTFFGIVVVYRTIIVFESGEILVIDQRDSTQGGASDTHWSFHPNCELEPTEKASRWTLSAGKVRGEIELVYPAEADFQIFKGQEEPFIAGWFAPDYNVKYPAFQIRSRIGENSPVHVWRLSPKQDRPTPDVITHMDGKISIHWPQPTEKDSILIDGIGAAPMRFEME
ncbi:MAG: heparinase II/III family protein [Opitutales bacterium]